MDWFGFATSETKTRLIALAAAHGLINGKDQSDHVFVDPCTCFADHLFVRVNGPTVV